MDKPSIVIKEVDVPSHYFCENGHTAPSQYRRNGPDSDLLPIRFWKVTGNGINKTICEPCLTVLNYLLKQKGTHD